MIPRVLLDTAKAPDGKELRLYQHDADFFIKVGSLELMNSRMHGSEEALAELACKELAGELAPRVLIGGLGMGFTLRAALDRLPAKANVLVAELVPAVVRWNRGALASLARHPLRDKRVMVHETDVAKMIQAGRGEYHAIVLDVDNGPSGLSCQGNDGLYDGPGLAAAYRALQPRGVLALWSAGPDRGFTRRLNKAGFTVTEVPVRSRAVGKGGGHHLIWIAKRYGQGPELAGKPASHQTRRPLRRVKKG